MKLKINNSLIALACGDSYGSHYESEGLMGAKFDIKSLPDKPIYQNITDDTKMAMILFKHYNKYKKLDIMMLQNSYSIWAKEDGDADGIGIHTKDVLVYHKQDKNSQGNGALMRNIPFGLELIDDGYSFEEAVDMMNIDSSITHKNSTIFHSNKLALDLAVNGIEVLKKDTYKKLLQKIHYGHTAWICHSLYIVIETFKQGFGFLDGFKHITSKGGDTDTNCAIYGAILGYRVDITKEINIDSFIDINYLKQI